jgi:hypothetical protein
VKEAKTEIRSFGSQGFVYNMYIREAYVMYIPAKKASWTKDL